MRLLTLQIHTDERRRTKMFGQMQVTRMFQLSQLETVDEAVAKLLEFPSVRKAIGDFGSLLIVSG